MALVTARANAGRSESRSTQMTVCSPRLILLEFDVRFQEVCQDRRLPKGCGTEEVTLGAELGVCVSVADAGKQLWDVCVDGAQVPERGGLRTPAGGPEAAGVPVAHRQPPLQPSRPHLEPLHAPGQHPPRFLMTDPLRCPHDRCP